MIPSPKKFSSMDIFLITLPSDGSICLNHECPYSPVLSNKVPLNISKPWVNAVGSCSTVSITEIALSSAESGESLAPSDVTEAESIRIAAPTRRPGLLRMYERCSIDVKIRIRTDWNRPLTECLS